MKAKNRVLLSGFGPFDKFEQNSSDWLAKEIYNTTDFNGGLSICTLPTEFENGFSLLLGHIEELQPDVVVAMGLAVGTSQICLEKAANNKMDARIPDNQGYQPKDEKIDSSLPEKLPSTLPIQKLLEIGNREAETTRTSESPGTYVCNDVMFRLMQFTQGLPISAGFIHVPQLKGMHDAEEAVDPEFVLGGLKPMIEFLVCEH